MKRYRVLAVDLDTRSKYMAMEVRDDWEPHIQEQHKENQRQLREEFIREYGEEYLEIKLQNLFDMGNAPFSILSFHNKFLWQIRRAFIIGGYYPALTSACALGERILNHLILRLREYYKATPEYRKVKNKESFDNWGTAIKVLEAWDVLLPEVATAYRRLKDIRHQKAIHFNPEIDRNERTPALEAIHTLTEIINMQFGVLFGPAPWFIQGTPGECFIKKDFEDIPFVKEIYLPNCALVGPYFYLSPVSSPQGPLLVIHDNFVYEDREITDDEFVKLRSEGREHQSQSTSPTT